MKNPKISVILATRNRAPILHDTISCLQRQDIQSKWEVIVVDDGSTDETSQVLSAMEALLPLKALRQPWGGKAKAVNLALGQVLGQLIVFTDDDVRPSLCWLAELDRAFHQYQEAGVFCGPIRPMFPDGTPSWLCRHTFAAPAFAEFTPPLNEGYLPPPLLPFGPNFAARASALGAMRMREDLAEQNLMGEDTDFVGQLRRTQKIVYLPMASVGHFIRKEQISLPWLFERSFIFGRSMMHATQRPNVLVVPSAAKADPEWADQAHRLDLGARLNYYYGQMFQSGTSARPAPTLESAINDLPWTGDPGMLAQSALPWLLRNPSKVPLTARDHFLVSMARL